MLHYLGFLRRFFDCCLLGYNRINGLVGRDFGRAFDLGLRRFARNLRAIASPRNRNNTNHNQSEQNKQPKTLRQALFHRMTSPSRRLATALQPWTCTDTNTERDGEKYRVPGRNGLVNAKYKGEQGCAYSRQQE